MPFLANLQTAWSGSALRLQTVFISQFHSGRHGLSRETEVGASRQAPGLPHGLLGGLWTPQRPFMSWDHYRRRLPVCPWGFSLALAGNGRKHHHTKPASYGQASCCLVKPNLQKECWGPLWGAASGCSLTVLLLASTFLLFAWQQEEHGHQPCARTSKQTRPLNSWAGGCPGMEGLRCVLCRWPSVIITLKSCGFTGRVWECCSFPSQHLVPITVNNLSPPSLPTPPPCFYFFHILY